jgi:predicted TIM-barrel fold metal-dependent hydrolase
MATRDRIDVHQHVVPPVWGESLADHGGYASGWASPSWTPNSALAFMDSQEIATGVLSLTAPGVQGWTANDARDMARHVNEYTAGLVSKRPDRLGNFATLPMQDLEGALAEIEYALDILKADGIVLLSNYHGRYLGDSSFEPLWTELNRRKAVVFVHPGKPAVPIIDGIPAPIVDYPFDTTRTAVQLVMNGVLRRHSDVRIILSHAGGFLPYASHRFAELASAIRSGNPSVADLLRDFQRFYFDTALSAGLAAFPSLTRFAGVDKILYGSDFPYAPASVGASFTAKLDRYGELTKEEHHAINRGNAVQLFPRLDRSAAGARFPAQST